MDILSRRTAGDTDILAYGGYLCLPGVKRQSCEYTEIGVAINAFRKPLNPTISPFLVNGSVAYLSMDRNLHHELTCDWRTNRDTTSSK